MSGRFPRIAGLILLGSLLAAALAAAAPMSQSSTAAGPTSTRLASGCEGRFSPAPAPAGRCDPRDASADVPRTGSSLLLQLQQLPSTKMQAALRHDGVHLVAYVTGNTYVASSAVAGLEGLDALSTSAGQGRSGLRRSSGPRWSTRT